MKNFGLITITILVATFSTGGFSYPVGFNDERQVRFFNSI